MANTSYLTTVVEEAVRAALAERHGVAFAKRRMPLLPGELHEFDADRNLGRKVPKNFPRLNPCVVQHSHERPRLNYSQTPIKRVSLQPGCYPFRNACPPEIACHPRGDPSA